jgi:DNA-binding transcriptional LysR family regulator
VALADLRDDGFILVRRPGAPGLYANLLALCEAQGLQPRVAAEVERMGTSLNLVAAGAGVSVVPASMQGQHSQAIAYLPLLESARLDAPLTLVYRSTDTTGRWPASWPLRARPPHGWHAGAQREAPPPGGGAGAGGPGRHTGHCGQVAGSLALAARCASSWCTRRAA